MPNVLSKSAKGLIKQYGLSEDPNDGDIFVSPRFKIITRQGVDKILAKANIKFGEFKVVFSDPFELVYMNTYSIGDNSITTTASASVDRTESVVTTKSKTMEDGTVATKQDVELVLVKKGNVMQKPAYLSEFAEKRCNSRGVMKLTGFYSEGFYGEDEADAFGDAVKNQKKAAPSVKSSKV